MTAADISPTPFPHVAAATAAASKLDLRDFSDRLSPMVVKELRQGLRSPLFVWVLILVHLVLGLVVLSGLNESDPRDISKLFWWMFVIPVVLLLPARGINALTDEVRLRTMDTLLLTRLSAWRICVGKWVSIIAQIWLIGITVLPYLVMRYFTGGLDIWLEVKWLVHFLVLASCLAAATVGISWQKYFFVRGLVVLGCAILLAGFCTFVIDVIITRPNSYMSFSEEGSFTALAYAAVLFVSYYCLDFAAAQIAPLAENRSTLRRSVTLVISTGLLVAVCLLTRSDPQLYCLFVQFWIMVLAGLDAATERTQQITVIVAPFVRKGWVGRMAGRLLYPGWHSGFYFLWVLVVEFAVGVWRFYEKTIHPSGLFDPSDEVYLVTVMFVAFFGQVILGLLIQRRFYPRAKAPLFVFLLIELALGFLHLLVGMLASVGEVPGLHYAMIWAPLETFVSLINLSHDEQFAQATVFLAIAIGLLVIHSLAMWILVRREFKFTRELETQAAADLT